MPTFNIRIFIHKLSSARSIRQYLLWYNLGMKILVTGGCGFIGSNFIHYLSRYHPDYFVLNLDKLTYAANPDNLRKIEKSENYQFVKGDICNAKLVDVLVRECDAVVHFAAETHVDRSILSSKAFIRTNVVGTTVLLDACLKHEKRFHHISTDEVFGFLPLSGGKFTEESKYDPSSPYSASKAASDHLVRAYHRTHGLKMTITNCSNNYGPYQHAEKLIPLAITHALKNEKIPVYGNGLNVRDWIFAQDHCDAIDLVLLEGEIGQTYLVGGNAERTNLQVVQNILHILGKSEDLIEFVPDRKGHDLRYAIDSTKIETKLHWKRQFDFETGLFETVDWYKKNLIFTV